MSDCVCTLPWRSWNRRTFTLKSVKVLFASIGLLAGINFVGRFGWWSLSRLDQQRKQTPHLISTPNGGECSSKDGIAPQLRVRGWNRA